MTKKLTKAEKKKRALLVRRVRRAWFLGSISPLAFMVAMQANEAARGDD